MTRSDRPDEPLLLGEVIGSVFSYHRPTCHIIQLISGRNYKRLRNWEEAVALGLDPCGVCRPHFIPPNKVAEAQPMRQSLVLSPEKLALLEEMRSELAARRDEAEAEEELGQGKLAEVTEKLEEALGRIGEMQTELSALREQEAETAEQGPLPGAQPEEDVALKAESEQAVRGGSKLTASQMADRRRLILRLLDALDTAGRPTFREGVAGRISRLRRAEVIPGYVSACMLTVTEMRNEVEYERKELSPAESRAVEGCLEALQEFTRSRELDVQLTTK